MIKILNKKEYDKLANFWEHFRKINENQGDMIRELRSECQKCPKIQAANEDHIVTLKYNAELTVENNRLKAELAGIMPKPLSEAEAARVADVVRTTPSPNAATPPEEGNLCATCGRVFKSRQALNGHGRVHK